MNTEDEGASCRLAEFCISLPQMQTAAAREGWLARLAETVGALQADPGAGDGKLIVLRRLLGIGGSARGADVEIGRSGHAPTPPPGGAYTCPRQLCIRWESRAPGEPVSACNLFGESLVWHR